MNWFKKFSGKSDTQSQSSGNHGTVGGLMGSIFGRNHDSESQSGYPNGNLLNNITGQGKGGFFNNFAGGVFGGKYYQGVGRAFAGKSGNEGGIGGQFGKVGNYGGGLINSLLGQNNQNSDASLEQVLSLVGGGGGGASTGSKVQSLAQNLYKGGASNTGSSQPVAVNNYPAQQQTGIGSLTNGNNIGGQQMSLNNLLQYYQLLNSIRGR